MADDAPKPPPKLKPVGSARRSFLGTRLLLCLIASTAIGALSYPFWPATPSSVEASQSSRQVSEWAQAAMMRDFRLHLFATAAAAIGESARAEAAANVVHRADAAPAAGAPLLLEERQELGRTADGAAELGREPRVAVPDLAPVEEVVAGGEEAKPAVHGPAVVDGPAPAVIPALLAPDTSDGKPDEAAPQRPVATVEEARLPQDGSATAPERAALPPRVIPDDSVRPAGQTRGQVRAAVKRQARSRQATTATAKAASSPGAAPVTATSKTGERLQWRSVFDGS